MKYTNSSFINLIRKIMRKIFFLGLAMEILGISIMFFANNTLPSKSYPNLLENPFFYGGALLLIGFIIMCVAAVIATERMVNPKDKPTKELPNDKKNEENDPVGNEEIRKLHYMFAAPENWPLPPQ